MMFQTQIDSQKSRADEIADLRQHLDKIKNFTMNQYENVSIGKYEYNKKASAQQNKSITLADPYKSFNHQQIP